VEHDVDVPHAARDRLGVDDAADGNVQPSREARQVFAATTRKVVEHAHRISQTQEPLHQRRPDEPSAARHEVCRHETRYL